MVVITQNIDGLHRRAGSKNILELHGQFLIWHSTVSCNLLTAHVCWREPLQDEVPEMWRDCCEHQFTNMWGTARQGVRWVLMKMITLFGCVSYFQLLRCVAFYPESLILITTCLWYQRRTCQGKIDIWSCLCLCLCLYICCFLPCRLLFPLGCLPEFLTGSSQSWLFNNHNYSNNEVIIAEYRGGSSQGRIQSGADPVVIVLVLQNQISDRNVSI